MAGFMVTDRSEVTENCSSQSMPQSYHKFRESYDSIPTPQPLLLPPLQIQLDTVRHSSPPAQSEQGAVLPRYADHAASDRSTATDPALSHNLSSSDNTYEQVENTALVPSQTNRVPRPVVVNSKVPASLRTANQRAPPTMDRRETEQLSAALNTMIELKEFLASAPTQFGPGEFIRQFRLPSEEQISCVRWKQVFCITGTDIVRSLVYRFSVIGREVINRKKFEEGVFSDLRNLKINVDATLENPKSELLELLYKHHCVRTKKKQKVFFWYSVQHDQLFMDTLERELKREYACDSEYCSRSQNGLNPVDGPCLLSGSPASTKAVREPALSFRFNNSVRLSEQIASITKGLPHDFATLVDATTTSLNIPPSAQSTILNSAQAIPIPHRPKNVHNNPSEYTFPSHPMTPVQSVDKVGDREAILSSWSHGRQQPAFDTPESLTSLSTPGSVASVKSTSLSPWTHINSYDQQAGLDPAGVVSARSLDPRFKRETEESDFPLEFLAQHDHEQQKPLVEVSFQNKYHDFVYNNRPALSVASPMVLQPYHSVPVGHNLVEQDWERQAIDARRQFVEERGSVSQQHHHPLSVWKSGNQHKGTLDPPFDYSPTRNSGMVRRGTGRVMKYANTQPGPPSISGGTFTQTY